MSPVFQSTLPGWGATSKSGAFRRQGPYFNPRSPGGERHLRRRRMCHSTNFNPRSPGGERRFVRAPANPIRYFNPRSPGGERLTCWWRYLCLTVFQSTLPGWGATRPPVRRHPGKRFQSTLPGWGATREKGADHRGRQISIHAPRVGSDRRSAWSCNHYHQFQSTLPGWGATAKMDIFAHDMGKIIHFQH